MKIEFTFDNITQLEELYYAVEHIPEGILEDEKELGTPVKEEQQLYEVIMKLKSKLRKCIPLWKRKARTTTQNLMQPALHNNLEGSIKNK